MVMAVEGRKKLCLKPKLHYVKSGKKWKVGQVGMPVLALNLRVWNISLAAKTISTWDGNLSRWIYQWKRNI